MSVFLGECNEHLVDVPFVAYYNMDMYNFDVEIEFPVPIKVIENVKL